MRIYSYNFRHRLAHTTRCGTVVNRGVGIELCGTVSNGGRFVNVLGNFSNRTLLSISNISVELTLGSVSGTGMCCFRWFLKKVRGGNGDGGNWGK